MTWIKFTTATLALLFAGVFVAQSAQAQSTFLRRTKVTLSGPVQIPGRVLPAGTYTFQLMPGNETNLVIIRDKDENALVTLLTIPDFRLTPTGDTVITFKEEAANSPQALRAWFYPGENYGHEFAYPRKVALQLAAANHENVPAIPDQTSDKDLSSAKITTVTPGDSQTQVAQTNPEPVNTPAANYNAATASSSPNTDSAPANNLVAQNTTLPKTASSTFLIALLGLFSFVAAGFLGILGRRFQRDEGRETL